MERREQGVQGDRDGAGGGHGQRHRGREPSYPRIKWGNLNVRQANGGAGKSGENDGGFVAAAVDQVRSIEDLWWRPGVIYFLGRSARR